MKKICSILMLSLVLVCGMFFVGCKDDYDKAKLVYDDIETGISLEIDSANSTLATTTIDVEMKDFDKKIDKQFIVYSNPSELVSKEYSVDIEGDTAHITITAITAGSGTLVVALKENMSVRVDIPLEVICHVKNVELKYGAMLITIPNWGISGTTFGFTNLALTPTNTTDTLRWQLAGENIVEVTEVVMDPINGSVGWGWSMEYLASLSNGVWVTGGSLPYVDGKYLAIYCPETNFILMSSAVPDGWVAQFYPEVMNVPEGSTVNEGMLDKIMTLTFCKIYEQDELALSSTTHGGEDGIVDSPLVLLTNYGEKSEGTYYNTTDITVQIKTYQYDEYGNKLLDDNGKPIVTYAPISDKYSVYAHSTDPKSVAIEKLNHNSFRIKAIQKTDYDVTNYIVFEVYRARFESVMDPEYIYQPYTVTAFSNKFTMTAEKQDVAISQTADGRYTATYDLYDVYNNADGAVVKFDMIPIDALPNFRYYTITMEKKYLQNDGNIYTDEHFDTVMDYENTNQYQLVFMYKGRQMKFYDSGEYFVSEPISANDTINVRYATITGDLSTKPTITLNNYVMSRYGYDFSYFDDLGASLDVTFNLQKGVESIEVMPEPDNTEKIFVSEVDSAESEYQYLELKLTDVYQNTLTSEVSLNISTDSPYCTVGQKDNEGNIMYAQQFAWTTDLNDGKIYYQTTRVGDYTIYIRHANGKSVAIPIRSYAKASAVTMSVLNAVDNSHLLTDTYSITKPDDNTDVDIFAKIATNSEMHLALDVLPSDAEISNIRYDLTHTLVDDDGAEYIDVASQYISASHDSLDRLTIKAGNFGTNISDKKYYVIVDVIVDYVYYESNETEHSAYRTGSLTFRLKLYIFVPVQRVMLNYAYINTKTTESVGYYDSDLAKVKLEVSVYPTDAKYYLDEYGAESGDRVVLSSDHRYKYVLSSDNVETDGGDGQFICTIANSDITSATTNITVTVKQNNREFYQTCTVHMQKATRVESLRLNTYLPVNADGESYISFKSTDLDKQTKRLSWNVYPSDANNKKLRYIAFDGDGSITKAKDIVEIDGDEVKAKGTGVAYILVAPEDCFCEAEPSNIVNRDNLTFLDPSIYKIIRVNVADGSYDNPYTLSSVQDILNMNTAEGLTKHYALTNDINMGDQAVVLGAVNGTLIPFTGSIRSQESADGQPIYTISGIKLTSAQISGTGGRLHNYYNFIYKLEKPDTEDEHSGEISNVKFNYSLDLSVSHENSQDYYIGLIGINAGKLTNVLVDAGNMKVTVSSEVSMYVGLLTAQNTKDIIISDTNVIGASGDIFVSTSAGINYYIGGLVGYNIGNITGAVNFVTTDAGSSFANLQDTKLLNAGAITDVDIVFSDTSGTVNTYVGGVVGRNVKGKITSVYATGSVVGTNNVGGIVGYNEGTNPKTLFYGASSINIGTEDSYQITRSYTTTTVTGTNNVGGVVGKDQNGSYYLVNSEMYSSKTTTDSAYIVGEQYVGGFAGYMQSSAVAYSYVATYRASSVDTYEYLADVMIYNDTGVSGGFYYVGGFAGYMEGTQTLASSVNAKVCVNVSNIDEKSIYAGMYAGYSEGKLRYGYTRGVMSVENYGGSRHKLAQIYSSKNNTYSETYSIATCSVEDIFNDKILDPTDYGNYFTKDDNINGGYPYLISPLSPLGDNKPLTIEAPIEVNISLKDIAQKDRVEDISTRYINMGDNTIALMMYKLETVLSTNSDQNTSTLLRQANRAINTFSLDALYSVTVKPAGTRLSRLGVKVDDKSKVEITSDGKIVLKDTGKVTLTIYSLLDEKQKSEVTIYIIDAINITQNTDATGGADGFNLYYNASTENGAYAVNNKYIRLEVGTGTHLREKFSNVVRYEDTVYTYRSNTENTAVKYSAVSDEYIEINGEKFSDGSIFVTKGDKYDISAIKKMSAGQSLKVTAEPYLVIAGEQYKLSNTFSGIQGASNLTKTFYVITRKGVQSIYSTVSEMSISSNNDQSMSLYVDTDEKDTAELKVTVTKSGIDVINQSTDITKKVDSTFTYTVSDNKDTTDPLRYDIDFAVLPDVYVTETTVYDLTFSVGEKSCSMKLSVTPEDIINIRAVNYMTKGSLDDDTHAFVCSEIQSDEVLPGDEYGSVLKITITPSQAHYDHLVLTNTNNDINVMFRQVYYDEANSSTDNYHYISTAETTESGINRIVLNKKSYKDNKVSDDNFVQTYYVRVIISSGDDDAVLDLSILPYIGGTALDNGTTISLRTVMLPKIALSYIDPLSNEQSDDTIPVALHARARIKVNTAHTDGTKPDITVTVNNNNEKYIVEEDEYGRYYLITENGEVGDIVTVTMTVKNTIHGIVETASDSITFQIQTAVIHGVSVERVYNGKFSGNFGERYQLRAYFAPNDISYWDEDTINTKTYYDDTSVDFISDILSTINTNTKYWAYGSDDMSNALPDDKNICFTHDTLIYLQGLTSKVNGNKIRVQFNYEFDGYKPKLTGDNVYTRECIFKVEFSTPTSLYSALPVYDAEYFTSEMSPGYHYILMNDITLTDYTPLDIDLAGFDGNGHTITIESYDLETPFAEENEITANLGLFAKVYSGMVVQNVTIVVPNSINIVTERGERTDIISNLTYGGITAENNGIITNCEVRSNDVNNTLVFNLNTTTTLDVSLTAMIGGLVGVNNSTGYITHSRVSHAIIGYGDLAGVVCENGGSIASSTFEGKKLVNSTSEYYSSYKTAGMAVTNGGKITMSYVTGGAYASAVNSNSDHLRALDGLIKSAGNCAGFVYTNNSFIEDCYADIPIESSAYISGFVFENNYIMSRCISLCKFEKSEFYAPLVGVNSDGEPLLGDGSDISDCYYLAGNIGATKRSPGKSVTANEFTNNSDTIYEHFSFGEDGKGVWQMTTYNNTPKPTLVSASERINPTKVLSYVENGYYYYSGVENNNLGSKVNPYIIYDTESFNTYLGGQNVDIVNGYFRIVSDIDFMVLRDNPATVTKTFTGSLEGNNMILSNITIYSKEKLTNLGLFGQIGSEMSDMSTVVKNINITPSSLLATDASCVGVLAGTLYNATVNNINIDNSAMTALGKNVVGGAFGQMKGQFSVNDITTNVSANASYRYVTANKYELYIRNNDSNLSNISYAGGIAGVVDYFGSSAESAIRNIALGDTIAVLGETVGAYFGLVGADTTVSGLHYVLNAGTMYKGNQVAGGIVGENRGTISDISICYADDMQKAVDALAEGQNPNTVADANTTAFSYGTYITGGVVGLNMGTLKDIKSTVAVINTHSKGIAGGLVGRNVDSGSIHYNNGNITTSTVSGYFVGGAVGELISRDQFTKSNITASSVDVVPKSKYLQGLFMGITANNNWCTDYVRKFVRGINDKGELQYGAVFGGLVGYVCGYEYNDVKKLFTSCKYVNLYKHNFTLENDNPLKDYFGLTPIGAIGSTENWSSSSGLLWTYSSYCTFVGESEKTLTTIKYSPGITVTVKYKNDDSDYLGNNSGSSVSNVPKLAYVTVTITSDESFLYGDTNATYDTDNEKYTYDLDLFANGQIIKIEDDKLIITME